MAKTPHFQLNDIFSPENADHINYHRHDGVDEDYHGVLDYYQDSGAANAYVIAPAPALTARIPGMPIYWKAAHANTGASTINDGLGAVAIKKVGTSALTAGDILAGQICIIAWDGAQYQLINAYLPPGLGLELVDGAMRVKLDGTTLSLSAAGLKMSAWTQSIGTNGYLRLPGGLIWQWGYVAVDAENHTTITFPLTFPTAMLNAQATCKYTNGSETSNVNVAGNIHPLSTSQMVVIADQSGFSGQVDGVYWQAIGH